MATKSIQAKNELFSTIWKAATQVKHGKGISSQQFMAYFLGMLFYRFISENIIEYVNKQQQEAGEIDFDYTKMSDEDAEQGRDIIVDTKGFFILPSQLFQNVVKHCHNDPNYNVTLHNIFKAIENSAQGTASEADVKGLFDDFNVNNQVLGTTVDERNKILSYLTQTVAELNMGDHELDLFGDAYEYLIGMYAADAGKSGGEFFTPQEVSELLVRITTHGLTQVNKVYDPACGSGGLLLKFKKVLGENGVRKGFFGQEINVTTYNLCRINMFLHNVNFDKFDIARGDTLINPQHWDDEPFDIIVSNPPYAVPWEGDDNPLLINDPRFAPAGVLAPKSKGDMAFIMHIVSWLSAQGTAAVIEFPGTLYRGGAEEKIRKYLVDNNFVDAIIQLPPDLFFGTGIATCVYILKKNKQNTDILFIDAGKEFIRIGNKNQLSEENKENIFNWYINRQDVDHICKVVDYDTVKNNKYNLSVSAYVETEDTKVEIDIDKLNKNIAETVNKENDLRLGIDDLIKGNNLNIEQLINKKCPNGVEWKELSEVGETYSGLRGKSKDDFKDGNARYITYKNIYNNLSVQLDRDDYVKVSEDEKQNYLKLGDILIAGSSENMEDSGMVSVVTIEPTEKIYLNSFCFGFRPNDGLLFPGFSKYLFRCENFRKKILKCSFGVTRYNLSKDKFLKIEIPIPPIEVQKEIADVLDKFTKLEAELEAELEARKSQYEYYRDKLLDFN